MGIAILSSDSYSRFDIGATELRKAQNAMKELNKLKVTKDTYKRADDAKSKWNWNWVTGDDAHKEKIEKQTKLENEVKKNLGKIAGSYERTPDAMDPAIMKQARDLEKQLGKRLDQDYAFAGGTSFKDAAKKATDKEFALHDALNDVDPQASALRKAQKAMKELDGLKVTSETYADAEDAKSNWNWNWITGDDAQKGKIAEQTKLENEVEKHLSAIAAANVRDPGSVDQKVMKAASKLEERWSTRLREDYQRATDTDAYGLDAYIAMSDSHALDRALNESKPDVIPLNETKSFLNQVTTLHDKIDDARWVFESGVSNEAERAKARKDVEKHWNDMQKKIDLVDAQAGRFWSALTDIKIGALPDGDPLKTAYQNQDKALIDLEMLFRYSEDDYTAVTQGEHL